MIDHTHIQIFQKYKEAGPHAFSNNIVTEDDKDIYQEIFSTVVGVVDDALKDGEYPNWFDSWSVRFGRDGGVQGHRPVDLWASVVNKPTDSFSRFPQTYVIASADGLEIGFTVAIHESDYYNQSVKHRNREIVPLLYRKLPSPEDELIRGVSEKLREGSGWV